MKYGESAFDLIYLVLTVSLGVAMLRRARSRGEKYMGLAALILGCGDAFHLLPRVARYFLEGDFTAALGAGKLITSLTMTGFYVLMYFIWLSYYRRPKSRPVTWAVWGLAAVRAALCLFPQNGWLTNGGSVAWAVLRNVPFAALGILILTLYYGQRKETKRFRRVWLYVALSFLFYVPVAVGAGAVPLLGMLMLPKTVCYLLLVFTFYFAVTRDPCRDA